MMSEDHNHYFHFTLGPVQGFVSQARRTRDFWAGSFLLSWLSAVAMKAVINQGGSILFPKANSDYMAFLEGKGTEGEEPKQGSIPNRFKAKVNEQFSPKQVTKAVEEAWKALSDYIWQEDIYAVIGDNVEIKKTHKIWNRQIPGFWDMSWVITDDEKDSSVLDRRKNWRTYFTPEEPGVKCSVMNGWQELSGVRSPRRDDMDKFWGGLRESGNHGIKSDLAKNEALCAIAYVKRRFSRYFIKFQHTMKQGWVLKGWDVPSGVPSTSYMAAVHWLERTIEQVPEKQLDEFCQEAKKLTGEYGEWETKIKCLQDKGNKYYKSLDGNVFFSDNLKNKLMFPDQEQAKKVLCRLKKINKLKGLDPVSPFYAILSMDGDSLGENMSDINKEDAITQALANFTQKTPQIVYKHNGFLIYAGGDDVLAILPLEDAIPCATELREYYSDYFKGTNIETSLSGAIDFAHVKASLTKILTDAHQLLEDIAKEKTGRDALAIRVWKPGGRSLQWSQPWEIALFDTPAGNKKTYLEKLVEDFNNSDKEDEQFSSKFLFKIRERFGPLNPADGKSSRVLNEEQELSLMAMEYLNSGKSKLDNIKDVQERINRANDIVRPLLKQCRQVIRSVDEKDSNNWERKRLEADGAMLVRFLAQKGIER